MTNCSSKSPGQSFDLKSRPESTVCITVYTVFPLRVLGTPLNRFSCNSNRIRVTGQESQDLSVFPETRRNRESQTRRKTMSREPAASRPAPGRRVTEGGGTALFSSLRSPRWGHLMAPGKERGPLCCECEGDRNGRGSTETQS